jgi:uncharacterized glyoxalase superfamily metalloenzyme YdcJ
MTLTTKADTSSSELISPTEIRHKFSLAMSSIYKIEVPLYSNLLDLVSSINNSVLSSNMPLHNHLNSTNQLSRLHFERHGAIRLGSSEEMATMARFLKVMGMSAIGYYDLSPANLPVHATCFRPTDLNSLNANPFRLFVSLLRPELISPSLRPKVSNLISRRQIFHPKTLSLISLAETAGGLTAAQAEEFIATGLETFKWRGTATTSLLEYQTLLAENPLLADVVAFAGPHINHLTPRTLDIDALQVEGLQHGIPMKDVIEGPPRRECPILLRQTSFKALQEKVFFVEGKDLVQGSHTARFGEVEQRGAALTVKGRILYDELVKEAAERRVTAADEEAYGKIFKRFPDDWEEMRRLDLCWFRYYFADNSNSELEKIKGEAHSIEELIRRGAVKYEAFVYEDFLPLSAAGIFQSNLGKAGEKGRGESRSRKVSLGTAARKELEDAVCGTIVDEMDVYAVLQEESLEECRKHFAIER